jgi:hypothetical protein
LAVSFLAVGCVAPKPVSEPMSGWNRLPDRDQSLNKSLIDDCQSYVRPLRAEGHFIDDSDIWFFQNGSGQHAIEIEMTTDRRQLVHVLIYDKNDKRIKVIKYASGWYRY